MAAIEPNNFIGTHLDLFSWIGGFALAASRTGWQTIGFCEIDKEASQILARRFPKIKNHGDIFELRNVKADLVTGGFPCQPFSTLGHRRGKSDDRWLWPQMLRVIKESNATWVVGENVAGFVSMALDDVLSDLEGIGYEAQAIIIPAAGVKAHHRRDRVWILAWNSNRVPKAKHGLLSLGRLGDGSPRHIKKGLPLLHRAPDGLPNRMDRVHALGNAIVPQVAEVILANMAAIHAAL